MKREVKRLWNCKEVVLVPIISGALVTVSKIFHLYLKKAGLDGSTQPLQKAELVLGQVWRHNSRRVRTHKRNSGDAVRRLGTVIQSIFCAKSEASIRLTVWKWSRK